MRAFLDEVVVPILAQRFLRERTRADASGVAQRLGTATGERNVAGERCPSRNTELPRPFPASAEP